MSTLAQRLSSHWELIRWLLGGGVTFVIGLVIWVMQRGGKERLLKWIVEVESANQNDAAQRIMCGFKALQAETGAPTTACFDFIGGLDQWRAMQTRITQRSSCVRRSDYPICVFGLFAAAVLILQIFEPPTHSWSALCVVGGLIAFVWLVWTILPLVHLAWRNGLPPHQATDAASQLDKQPNSPIAAPHQK